MMRILQVISTPDQSIIASRAQHCASIFAAYLSDHEKISKQEGWMRPPATRDVSLDEEECDSSLPDATLGKNATARAKIEDQEE